MSEFKPCQDLDLKPCPMCGESLIKHSDHHGEWYAHRLEPGPCILSFMQIFDQKDAAAWNTRVSPDLTARIEAAAEEIRDVAIIIWDPLPDGHWLKDIDDKLAAIIRRHMQGGK